MLQQIMRAAVAAVVVATQVAAVAPVTQVAAVTPADVTATMQRVANYYVAHAPAAELTKCGWTHSAFLQGAMATWRATRNASWLAHATRWAEQNAWTTCNYPKVLTEHAGANDMSCGQTYAELWLERNASSHGGGANDTWLASIRDDVLEKLVLRPQIDDWWWDDAYFMAMGAFARIGHISAASGHRGSRFHDKAWLLFNDSATRRGLWSAEAGLFFRDETYKNQTTPHGQHVFWGRGNGWAAGALARTLQYTPATHVAYPVYVARLRAMAATLKRVQGSDGLWRASVLDPLQVPNPETTGSCGMLLGLAWGVNAGVLPAAEYGPVALAAWAGLGKLAVHPDGLLGYCQPVGGGPAPATPTSTSDFCVGLFLLAAEQMAQMAQTVQ